MTGADTEKYTHKMYMKGVVSFKFNEKINSNLNSSIIHILFFFLLPKGFSIRTDVTSSILGTGKLFHEN